MKSLKKKGLQLVLLTCLLALAYSCKKEKPTLAKVRVVNINNETVPNAEVILFPNPSPVLGQMVSETLTSTDQNGIAIVDFSDDFNLGQAGFRVLDIAVNSGDTIFGTGIIKITEEKTNAVSIIVAAP
jgi:hypothetical protein